MSLESARRVLRIEAAAIEDLAKRLDATFDRAVDLLFACKGRVAVTGMGKSGLIGRKISATFASTGTPSFYLHPAEALHGDLGMLARGDIAVALSYGGETEELVALIPTLQRMEIPIVALTGQPRSSLGAASAVVLDVSVKEEACSLNLAPTASTTAALAIGDALAIALFERRGFSETDFAALHPSGRLGRKLMRVEALMHSGDALPRVTSATRMPDIIYEMSKKGLGMTTVLDEAGNLAGIVTDGDLRRLMQSKKGATLELSAEQAMTRNPVTIAANELASTALNLMEQRKITSVVVVDESQRVLGVVHLHDLWALELY
ncbi:MAG TPA: KpsF/GutQ family sugar-phosphate isomerase [Candidatus Acidoferrum sp.]|nr:KpsF/GutQ family sugar-phosphate isomerase [Candidatus Acidoferrum sp.]